MHSSDYSQQSDDYKRIEKAIQFIESNFISQPTLDQIAESVHLSKYHFDRIFKRWAGISPIQFMQFLTLDFTKQRLAESKSLLDTALDAYVAACRLRSCGHHSTPTNRPAFIKTFRAAVYWIGEIRSSSRHPVALMWLLTSPAFFVVSSAN